MGIATLYLKAHDEIAQDMGKISNLLNSPDQIAKQAEQIRALLTSMTGKLKVHLAMEDDVLYPKLSQHQNADVRAIAKRFSDEMGGLKKAFTDYVTKWPGSMAIQKDPAAFMNETKGVLNALAERVKKENTELFPMVDKL
jgi:hemerythrin-like domain-containing protein